MAKIREVLEAQDRMSAVLNRIEQRMESLDSQTKKTKKSIDLMAKIQVGQLLVRGIGMAINAGREFLGVINEQITAEQQLATVMRNQGMDNAAFQNMKKQAAEMQKTTTYGDNALIAAQAELATYLKTEEALSAIMGTMADYAAGMGGASVTQKQMVEYATQLGKALDGTYDGLRKKGFILTEAQEKIMEVGTEMERVAVISDVIGQSWEGMAAALKQTPEGKMQSLGNQLRNIKESVMAELLPSVMALFDAIEANMPGIEAAAVALASLFKPLVSFITTIVIPAVGAAGTWITDNIETIKLALGILMIAMGAYAAYSAVAWMIANWPVTLVIAGIVGLIAILDALGITTRDVLQFVGGLFMGVFGAIYNICAGLYNVLASFGEFVGSFLIDPIGSIMRLFVGLADFVLMILQTLAGAIDFIFGSHLADGIQGWRDGMNGWVVDVFGESPVKYDRMEEANMQTMIEEGVKMGSHTADVLDSLFTGPGEFVPPEIPPPELGDIGIDGAGGGGGGINVNKVKEPVEIKSEDLKMIRDLAEKQAIVNLHTMAPVVDINISNTGGLSAEDIGDTVINRLFSAVDNYQVSNYSLGAAGG